MLSKLVRTTVLRRLKARKAVRLLRRPQKRYIMTIQEKMKEKVPQEQERVKQLLAKVGDKELSKVTVKQAFQGMRGVKALICETSSLDEVDGIKFRGLSVPEIESILPRASCRGLEGEYALPESLFWLLLTGEIPTEEEARQFSEELTHEPRTSVPKHVRKLIEDSPAHQHPMSQFASAVLALQTDSKFAKAYEEGVHRSQYWEYALDDALNLIARIPQITARIYRTTYRDGVIMQSNPDLDWSANWCHMAGFGKEQYDLMRMYFAIHAEHEAGNASAHTTHLVGSTLSDPYLSFAAGLCGLAGPLHGLANQESLRFVKRIKRSLGDRQPTHENVRKYVMDLLESGQVVPGFGHAVLKKTDPRYMIQREFAMKYMPDDELFQIVNVLFEVVPGILKEWKGGKVANPYPNLDAHSGCCLQHFGITETHFYTVLFGMGRALGVMSQYVVSKYLHLPIERPKSVTTQWLEENMT